ncbi:zinc finger, CCHC-type containing protein [Tanacetum coccineum]
MEMNMDPPSTLFSPISPPSLEEVNAITLEKTSVEPFPNGSKVVPAIAGERLSVCDKCSTAGQKYSDAGCVKSVEESSHGGEKNGTCDILGPCCRDVMAKRPQHYLYANEMFTRDNMGGQIVMLLPGDWLNIVNNIGKSSLMSTFKLNDSIIWFCYVCLLHSKDEALNKFKVFETEVELQQGSLIKRFRTDRGGERALKAYLFRYAEHSKAFRYYVIEPNDSVVINSIIESRDTIFDENRFSSVPRPSLSIPKGTEDIGGSVVPEVVTDEEQWMRKEAIIDEMDSIMGNNTWVLADLPPGCKWIFKRKLKVDGTIKKFKARLVIQGFKQKSRIEYFDTYAPVVRISTIRLLIAMASIHNLIIHQMDVKTALLNGDLDEEAPKQWHQKFDEVVLSNGYLLNQADKCVYSKFDESGKGVIICLYVDDILIFGTNQVQIDIYGYPSVLEGYTDASWISNTEDNSSTSGWVFLLGGGVISWASKKQTCITGSTMESEFMALAAADKKAEWLKNLLLEIPLWSKPIAPIYILLLNSAATLGNGSIAKMLQWEVLTVGVRP